MIIMQWPNNKKFAFTIVDDTDEATVSNVKPVYDFIREAGLTTTKTVWAFPSRDEFGGETLSDEAYSDFILELASYGTEIAFHGAGSGNFNRAEILEALELFKELLGSYPGLYINHAFNSHNLYWGEKRFTVLIGCIYRLMKQMLAMKDVPSLGEVEGSTNFWGDFAKREIKYIRNRVYTSLNTLDDDPYMPYIDTAKAKYSNYWFSSSDGYDLKTFLKLMSYKNIDQLEKERGCAIVYTHFAYGFVDQNSNLSEEFKDRIKYLASKDGWFAPASSILDYLKDTRGEDVYVNDFRSLMMDMDWIVKRIMRKILWRV